MIGVSVLMPVCGKRYENTNEMWKFFASTVAGRQPVRRMGNKYLGSR